MVSRDGGTVFGGLYRVEGWIMAPPNEPRPLTGDPNDGQVAIHQLAPEPTFGFLLPDPGNLFAFFTRFYRLSIFEELLEVKVLVEDRRQTNIRRFLE